MLDVRPASGTPAFRTQVRQGYNSWKASRRERSVLAGEVIAVLCDSRHQKAKFDESDPRLYPDGDTSRCGSGRADTGRQQTEVADQLTKLAALRDGGALTDAEFEAQKQKLLGTAAIGSQLMGTAGLEPRAGFVPLRRGSVRRGLPRISARALCRRRSQAPSLQRRVARRQPRPGPRR